ncbi:MAG: hypothetical protein ROY82_01850 [Truepera sp.]|jgi:hypothetical protein|nr:hypothetical protein [Truepera sp.]
MTLPQLFRALIHALTTCPEGHQVDALLADLAARTALTLHETKADSLKLACLTITNPEPLIAVDRLLHHYGFTLTASLHQDAARLISIKRFHAPITDLEGRVRATSTKGELAA